MLHKTKGIVFKFFKYSDTSIIAKIFTAKFGLQTYIVNGVRSKKSKNKIALFQPLTILDLVVYYNPTRDINRIAELKCSAPFQTVHSQMQKTAVTIFLAEILYKSIKDQEDVEEMFEFISSSISLFDHLPDHFQNFHLQFLLKLTRYIGFAVELNDPVFDTLDVNERSKLQQLLKASYEDWVEIKNADRRKYLDLIVRFYKSHVESINEINSIKILQEIF